ncbi:hypothetical protein [Mycolicibacterium sphagni]|uniref:Alanine and proline rich protein n=1 Tax=Mycolicibacterium sphagni TaxID=1786 RepID=A0A255DKJ4_9MYCO|nr:hypothetical protein [Mycolicibacterium sphagni]OYN79181.1 hypothetical protein CG716_12470 [Mycolicibacterium sphagni]
MTFDVAARLAAGRPSVCNTQVYVSACHAVGYQQPDLTGHGVRIVEWYSGEDGLDLGTLDADCALLRAAAIAADQAISISRDACSAVSAAWGGESGSLAADFTDRHCAAGEAVAQALRAAAEACESLRDSLGRLVDEKVTAAVSIDDRRAGERSAWLAAAAIVTGGGAARDEAVAVVTEQITPYVDTDIRTEWVTAMRLATSSAAAAYEDALRQLSAFPTAYFEVPGHFDAPPASASSPDRAVVQPTGSTVPAAAALAPAPVADSSPAPSAPMADASPSQPLPSVSPAEPAIAPGLGGATPAGMPAMPDAGGGQSGLVGQIVDALGGLFDDLPDTPAEDDLSALDDAIGQDEHEEVAEPDDDEEEAGVESAEQTEPEDVPVAEESVIDDGPAGVQPQVTEAEPAQTPPSPPLPPEPPPSSETTDETKTPCEIAADELPQVGQ